MNTCEKHSETMERIFTDTGEIKTSIKLIEQTIKTVAESVKMMEKDLYTPEKGLFASFAKFRTKMNTRHAIIGVLLMKALAIFIYLLTKK